MVEANAEVREDSGDVLVDGLRGAIFGPGGWRVCEVEDKMVMLFEPGWWERTVLVGSHGRHLATVPSYGLCQLSLYSSTKCDHALE